MFRDLPENKYLPAVVPVSKHNPESDESQSTKRKSTAWEVRGRWKWCILEWHAPRIPSLEDSGVMMHSFNLLVCQLRASRSPRGRYDLVMSRVYSCCRFMVMSLDHDIEFQ
jgi:hypothetical protein